MANSEDPDEMQLYAAFRLDLHFLPKLAKFVQLRVSVESISLYS